MRWFCVDIGPKCYGTHNNSNFKCVNSIIKYIGFESFYYTINLDIVSSFVIFNDFSSIFSFQNKFIFLIAKHFSLIRYSKLSLPLNTLYHMRN